MLHLLKNFTYRLPILCTVLCLVCTISLVPVTKVHSEATISSTNTGRMIPVPAVSEDESSVQKEVVEESVTPKDTAAVETPLEQPVFTTKETEEKQIAKDIEKSVAPKDTAPVETPLEQPAFTTKEAEEKQNVDTNQKTLLYIGGGAAVAAALALALGGGGSSGSDSGPDPEPEPPTPPVRPVGADIAGDNWFGFLELVNGYRESITAVIKQNGSDVEITTSATQRYGRSFRGQIYANGQMLLYDQVTGEDWTTFKGPATWNLIDLYDYVNNFTALDRLYLKRR